MAESAPEGAAVGGEPVRHAATDRRLYATGDIRSPLRGAGRYVMSNEDRTPNETSTEGGAPDPEFRPPYFMTAAFAVLFLALVIYGFLA